MMGDYSEFQRREGVPVIQGISVENLVHVHLAPCKRRGGLGAYLNLGYQPFVDSFIAEAPPNGSLNPEKHLYEEMVYVIKGTGHTLLGYGQDRHEVKWKENSLFAVPLNCFHQHFNDSNEPARLLFYSNLPAIMGSLGDVDIIFNSDFVPNNRRDSLPFSGLMVPDDSSRDFEKDPKPFSKTDYIFDIKQLEGKLTGVELRTELAHRGLASIGLNFPTKLRCHVMLVPHGHYAKAHRHGGGAYIATLSGSGYSVFWEEGKQKTKIPWKTGGLESPPAGWFHQHFNTGNSHALQLALKNSVAFNVIGGDPITGQPVQLERDKEEASMREEFEREIAVSK